MPTPEQLIRDAYGFDFPPDFFPFREFLAALPRNLLDDALEIHSAYPFKAADGKQPRDHPNRPHWEDRYYNDPPEFVTILHGRTDGLHWGYYFDDPATSRAVVASFYSNDAFQFSIDGDSLFEAVRMSVEYAERDFQNFLEDEPDEKKYYEKKLKQL
ncbi:MAG TPA: ADP-ribosylation family protein, partial [Gemmataceae bacterium]|nr:ADP-ribosylation family protein [Gemmataceae bacterium]